MIYLTTNHGTGDTYMTLAFAKAVERHRGQLVQVAVPPQHAAIAAMFPDVATGPIPAVANLSDNVILAHPSTSPWVRTDHLCLLSRRLTHADLWRAMLDLPPDEPMRRGQYSHHIMRMPKRVFLIRNARSMPNSAPQFWTMLEQRLSSEGWDVRTNLESHPLDVVFQEIDNAEWVIGPQCGVMSIICHAMFPCRKTIATPSLDGHHYFKRTRPYADSETFAGERYADLDEVTIGGDINTAVEHVLYGPCARRDCGSGLVSGVQVELSHGDFFDRCSILALKMMLLPLDKRSRIQREYIRYWDVARPLLGRHGAPLTALYESLLSANREAWDHNERLVTDVLSGVSRGHDGFDQTVRHNKRRVELKAEVDALCSSAYSEVKSYYEEGTQ